MRAETELVELLGRFNRQTAIPLSKGDSGELTEVALAAAELEAGAPRLAQLVADGTISWASVWADPLAEGQVGLDLLGAVMRRAARER